MTLPVSKNVKMKKKRERRKEEERGKEHELHGVRVGPCLIETSTLFHERRARITHGSYSHVSVWRAGSRSLPRRKRNGEDRKIQASE